MGTITDDLMRNPDMWDSDGEPCLLVVKNGNATGTTIGRANGVFSIVRDYFYDMSINQTSMEWGIINYGSKPAEVFFGTWRFGLGDRRHPWPYRWHAYGRFW
jgi:hypothetical protein